MTKYKFMITQTNEYEVFIEAPTVFDAIEEYNQLMTDDFGEPVSSRLDYEVINMQEITLVDEGE